MTFIKVINASKYNLKNLVISTQQQFSNSAIYITNQFLW